ncbi:Transposase IS4 [Popillia japonica]|uniref:Transposase IS4 n=1 Tax=Popillia japonica TaxID=7064 RepID=A0AAW1N130_POPJA
MPAIKAKLKRGVIESFISNNLLALKWQDKREVALLSTFHTPEMDIIERRYPVTNEQLMKPKVVIDYNNNIGAVDRTGMLQSSIDNIGAVDRTGMLQSSIASVRKSVKWYKKVLITTII